MAFREDAEALHARIESLERELETARGELARLADVERERDRLRARLEQLEPKKKPKPPREASASPGTSSSWTGGRRPQRGAVMVLGGLVAVLVLGLVAWALGERSYESLRDAAPKPPDTRPPTIGVVDLDATPRPVPVPFTVTGTEPPPGGCRGYLPPAPQLVLRTAHPTFAVVTTRCDTDLVAVLSGLPTGVLCDDDGGEGTNPRIETVLPAGEVRLTIGTYGEGATASCILEVQAHPLADGADASGLSGSAEPSFGTARLGAEPLYAAERPIEAAWIDLARIQPGCRGFVGSTPALVLDVTEPAIARVDARGDADLVLVMQGPDGTLTCDDDDGPGNAPRIAKRLEPGRYPVWVGTFSALEASPSVGLSARLVSVASEAARVAPLADLDDGVALTVRGTSGDELAAESAWPGCAVPGFVPYEPQQTVRLAARRDVTMVFRAGEATMFVIAPHDRVDGRSTWCGASQGWSGTLDAGTYDFFVGVASGESSPAPFELSITSSAPSVLPYTP